MRARDTYLKDFMTKTGMTLVVACYQRCYDWSIDLCEKLLNDFIQLIIEVKQNIKDGKEQKQKKFIGEIYHKRSNNNVLEELINGQQRIVTIFLMLKVVYLLTLNNNTKNKINNILFDNYSNNSIRLKICNNRTNDKIFKKIINSESFLESDFSDAERNTRLYCNYEYLYKRIKNKIESNNLDYEDFLLVLDYTQLIDGELEEFDNPQLIYDRINSTNIPLGPYDSIKNYLFQNFDCEVQNRIFEKYWLEIEEALTKEEKDNLMLHFLVLNKFGIEGLPIPSSITLNNLYKLYQIYYSNLTESEMIDFSSKLLQCSKYYKKFISYKQTFNEIGVFPKDEIEWYICVFYYIFERETSTALYLYFYNLYIENQISKDVLLGIFKTTLVYIVRSKFCIPGGLSKREIAKIIHSYHALNKFDIHSYNRIIANITNERAFPTDEEFANALKNESISKTTKLNKIFKFILYMIEKRRGNKELPMFQKDCTTLEHICPQDTTLWNPYLIANNDYDEMQVAKYALGNLCLTASSYNGEMSNKFKNEKWNFYQKSSFWLTREIAEYKDWNSNIIRRRTLELTDEILELFPLISECKKNKNPKEKVYNLYTSDKIESGIKPQKITIFGKEEKVSNWTQVGISIAKTLYDIDKDLFIKIGNDKSMFPKEQSAFSSKIQKSSYYRQIAQDAFVYIPREPHYIINTMRKAVSCYEKTLGKKFAEQIAIVLKQ